MTPVVPPTGNDYWESRGREAYTYRGETFYTLTPIPLYVARRELLVGMLGDVLRSVDPGAVCDFGCGDGYYMRRLSEAHPAAEWCGVDLAASMLDQASRTLPTARFVQSDSGILDGERFDLVYAIAVLAHVGDDQKVSELVRTIHGALVPGGCFVLFEQTGPAARGDTWTRRPTSRYLDLMDATGFECVDRRLVAFPCHRLFERSIARAYYRWFSQGPDASARRISANRSGLFLALSRAALASDRLLLSGREYRDDGTREGNTFYAFRKRAPKGS